MKNEVLRMERVTYQEAGTTLLQDFNLVINAGEILGLIPINHYGVSACVELMKKNHPLHYGFVYYNEKQVNHWRYPNNTENRVSVIGARSALADNLTVADNIFVLRSGFRQRVIKTRLLKRELSPFLQEMGVEINAGEYVENLGRFQRLLVEILKAIVVGNRLIIIDNPAMLISGEELSELYEILRHYTKKGISFLYITNRQNDAVKACDRIAVMQDGRIRYYFNAGEKIPPEMLSVSAQNTDGSAGTPHLRDERIVMELENVSYGDIREQSLKIPAGERCRIRMEGTHFTNDLMQLLLCEAPCQEGRILIAGEKLSRRNRHLIAVISEFPTQTMIFPDLTYMENLLFNADRRLPKIWRNSRAFRGLRREYAKRFSDVVYTEQIFDLNRLQKYDLVYHRILVQKPLVVFCMRPYLGTDVTLRNHIKELMDQLQQDGIAVVEVDQE